MRKSAPSCEDSEDLSGITGAERIVIEECDDTFASQPAGGVTWTGLPFDLIADASAEKKNCLDFISGRQPTAAIFSVAYSIAHKDTLMSMLRVAKKCGESSNKYTLVVLFDPAQIDVVQPCISSLFPGPTSTSLGSIVMVDKNHRIEADSKSLLPNVMLAYYCHVNGDNSTYGSPLQTQIATSNYLGWPVRVAPGCFINPLAPFNIWLFRLLLLLLLLLG
jgi:hypothetical protein